MTGTALVRPVSSVAWELRGAWATGARVSVNLERCDLDRIEGSVSAVSATGATARIAGVRFPLDRVLAVHKPSRLGDSTARGTRWAGAPRAPQHNPGQLPLS